MKTIRNNSPEIKRMKLVTDIFILKLWLKYLKKKDWNNVRGSGKIIGIRSYS